MFWVKMGEENICKSTKQKLLGMETGLNLSFDDYLSSLCRKERRQLKMLSRFSKFMSLKQKGILMETFVEPQFGYCLLISMFHSRKINNKIIHLQERSLRIMYDDYTRPFEDLLRKDNSFKIHHNFQKTT